VKICMAQGQRHGTSPTGRQTNLTGRQIPPNKSLDAKDTSSHSSNSLDTVDTSDKLPDTDDDVLPDSTKGRVTGLPNFKDSDRSSHLNNGDRSSPLEMPDSLSEDTSDRLSHFDKPDSSSDDDSDRSSPTDA
jgi:hypothetical protein